MYLCGVKKFTDMKLYTINFKKEIELTYTGEELINGEWVPVEKKETVTDFTTTDLRAAKAVMKANPGIIAGTSILKVYANGDCVNCGEISLNGNNKTYVANTRQTISNY